MKVNCKICGKNFEKTPKTGKNCSTCASRVKRKNHPLTCAYHNLKASAKKRKIQFQLTFEQFKKFAVETKYIIGKGKESYSLAIDRIDATKGYTIENLQVLTQRQNGQKSYIEKKLIYIDGSGLRFWRNDSLEFNEEEYPF